MRQSRKIDHINYALAAPDQQEAGFTDVSLLHRSLPELSWDDIDTSCNFLGKRLTAPLIINAMTGGHPDVEEINRSLAKGAQRAGVAIALGSQRAALEDKRVANTFQVVRAENPDGVVIANLSAHCTVAEAQQAVDMLTADAIQLHVNVPQELAMAEGDRQFNGLTANIAKISGQLDVPVIIKEVGFGMSMETVTQIYQTGVHMIDISGRGGTNFIAIEEQRYQHDTVLFYDDINQWGLSTVISLLETQQLNLPISTIASGGVRTPYDIAKALALGAKLVGISRPFLQTLLEKGEEELHNHIQQLIIGLRKIMLMCSARDIAKLSIVPAIITGSTAEWLTARGIDIGRYAKRK